MEVKRAGKLLYYDESRIELEGSRLLLTTEYKFTDAPLRRRIFLDGTTLLPLRSETVFTSPAGQENSLEADYGDREIRVKKSSGGNEEVVTSPLPEQPCYDHEQLMLLVRALPLERGWRDRIRLFVPATAQAASICLEVIRQEEITVPAGTYDCHVVELSGLDQWAWIGAAPPYPLVKYVDEKADTLSELVEYIPGDSEDSR